MALSVNAELSALLEAATDQADWFSIFETAFATRRVVCKRNGTTFRDCALTGAMVFENGAITHIGYTSDTTVYLAADLSTGSSVLRLESASHWMEGTLGLSGSGCDFIMDANPTTANGLAFGTVSINAPTGFAEGGTLATMTLANTSGSTVSSDFIPPMFGHPFKKGDIPSGSYPKFELSGGTNVPYTMFNTRNWSDGSLKFASFLIRVPTTIAGSGTLDILVKSTTTAPSSSSSRSLSDLSSGSADLKVELTGLENLSGTWTSSLNQGVTDNDDVITFGDGAVGKVWRIRQQFMQSAANHGQLECYWYVSALQNAAGGLYGLRYLGRVSQPWYDVDSPAKTHRILSGFTLKNGASTVRDSISDGGFGSAVSFSYSGHAYNVTATAHGLENGTMVRVAGTALPTGLTAGTNYFIGRVDANTVWFGTSHANAVDGTVVGLSGSASGATLTPYPVLTHFGSLWTCGSTGKWDYLQAGGTISSEATVRVQHDAAYWQTTGVVPTYGTTTPDAQTSYGYELNTMGPIQHFTGGTGEREDIGLLPSWHARHLLLQGATEEQVSRVVGLAAGHTATQLYNATTKTLPVVNNTTYSGMPAANSSFYWNGNVSSGFTAPTGQKLVGMSTVDFSHMPSMAYYPYLMTGEPQFLDLTLEWGQFAVTHRYAGSGTSSTTSFGPVRNGTVNGTAYYGLAIGDDNTLREDAWSLRDLGFAAGIAPDSAPQCAAYKSHLLDMYNSTFDALENWTTNQAPSFYRTAGLMHFRQNGGAAIGSPWMHGYFTMATAMTYKLTENADALTMLNHACKYYDMVYTNFGGWHIGSYRNMLRTGDAGNSPYITTLAEVAFYEVTGFTWTTGTNVFTFASGTTAGYFANGDKLIFDLNDSHGAPSGLSTFTPYYIINKSGTTFQLSASPGGSVATVSGSGSGGALVTASNAPATGCIEGFVAASGSMAGAYAATRLAKAAGATIGDSTLADIASRMSGVDFDADPKYYFDTTF